MYIYKWPRPRQGGHFWGHLFFQWDRVPWRKGPPCSCCDLELSCNCYCDMTPPLNDQLRCAKQTAWRHFCGGVQRHSGRVAQICNEKVGTSPSLSLGNLYIHIHQVYISRTWSRLCVVNPYAAFGWSSTPSGDWPLFFNDTILGKTSKYLLVTRYLLVSRFNSILGAARKREGARGGRGGGDSVCAWP